MSEHRPFASSIVAENELMKQKKQFRQRMKEKRNCLSEAERTRMSKKACQKAIDWVLHPKVSNFEQSNFVLLAYMPSQSELDITSVLNWCLKRNIQVALPKVEKTAKRLTFHQVKSLDHLTLGPYRIYEPSSSMPLLEFESRHVVSILVPGIAFDRLGHRMGYGGGYYDRFVEWMQGQTISKLHLWSVCYEMQMVDLLPAEKHDLVVEQIVTEQIKYECSENFR